MGKRRFNKAGKLSTERAAELEALGMVWSHQDVAFEEGLTAASQFYEREGHLNVPRKHAEHLEDGQEVKLGMWIDNNNRRRAGKLSDQRRNDLDALGMRW